MKNLCYFCHYHRGDTREKTIKIAGSLVIVTMIFILGGAAQISQAAQEYSAFTVGLLPEPGYLIAQVATEPGQNLVQPESPQPTVVEGQPSAPPPSVEQKESEDMRDARDADQERREQQDAARWKQDKLREWRDQLREVGKVRQQLVRLKGSQDEMVKLEAVKARLTQCQAQLNAATNTDAMKDVLEGDECGDMGEAWEEINRIRQAVELPKELNNMWRDITRAKNVCKQKWVDKVFSRDECNTIMANFATKHAEAKAAYQAGEYEDARAILQETFHEPGWPGDVNGALQMMRGFIEPLRRVKDAELKAQLDELMAPVKEALRGGEYREARETMEAIQRELGQKIFDLIFDSERKRRAVPDNVMERIERLQQKFEAMENQKSMPADMAKPMPEVVPAQ